LLFKGLGAIRIKERYQTVPSDPDSETNSTA
jgi:hypothetical protein